jgi:Glycosyltransferase sugar-binding region containing DXD motif
MSDPPLAAVPSSRIGQYWDREKVPDYIAAAFATFRDANPNCRHEIYSEAGAERLIAARFGARELAAFRACAVPSMQSDYFRYCFVLAFGGVYVDADYRCRRSLGPLLDEIEEGVLFLGPGDFSLAGREAKRVWSGFFAFRRPGHPFLRVALDVATANLEARIAERVWAPGENVRAAVWLTVGPGIPSAMRWMREWGSFEAFLEAIAGTVAEPFGELYCEAVGDYRRIVEAFEGVSFLPVESMWRWVADVPVDDLPYKRERSHWHNVETAIFR